MRSSRLRTTILRFQKPKAIWSNPEQSIGKLLGIKKGKFHIWEANGPAREVFERIKSHITELLEYSCSPVPSSSFVLFDIFMIGEARETALPHIMFACKHSEPRKSAVAAMRKSNILEQCPPGIHFGDWDYPPHLKDLQYLASTACYNGSVVYTSQGNVSNSPHHENEFMTIYDHSKQGTGQTLQMVLQNTSTGPEYLRTATIGSIVMLSGRRFYLAPAHSYYPQGHILPDMVSECSRPEDSDCDFGGFEDGYEGVSDFSEAEFMSQYSLTPESSDLEEDWDLDEDGSISDAESDCLTSEVLAERPISSIVASGAPAYYPAEDASIPSLPYSSAPDVKSPFLKSDNLDYCLIEVDETEDYMLDLPVLSRENIGQLNSGSVDVMAATGSGNVLTGVLSSRLSSIRLPNGTRFTKFLSVQFEGPLQPGDSGSIVRDASTGMIYGHIVAGDTGSRTAIIIPAVDVLNDIMAKSTSTEIPSPEHNYESFTDQRELVMTRNENGEMSVHASRKCPFQPEDSWLRHTARQLRRSACISYPRSVGSYDKALPSSQISGRAETRSNTTRNGEMTSLASSGVIESVYEENNFSLDVKSLQYQRPDPKADEWEVNEFSERLECQSAQDTLLGMDAVEPDQINPTSASENISLIRPSHWNKALIGDYTIGRICAMPTEDVAARAFLDEEQDGPSFNTSYQAHKNIDAPQAEDTCRWILDCPKFRSWKNSDYGNLLWLSAAIRTLLHLVSRAKTGILRKYAENTIQPRGERPGVDFESIESLGQMLTIAAFDIELSTRRMVCLLDALDECQRRNHDRLIQELERFSGPLRGKVGAGSNSKFLKYLPAQGENGYTLGQVGKHYGTISCLPPGGYGSTSTTNAAKDMMHRLPTIPIILVVGIGGSLPNSGHDIRLGDVVVSIPSVSEGCVKKAIIKLLHNDGWTPLVWAAANGHEEMVKLLLARGQADQDSKDNGGWTPLVWAAANGHEAIVKLLLATGQVDPDSKDNRWWKLLPGAAGNRYEAIVELLLATGQVDPDPNDNRGRTSMSWAAPVSEASAKLLLPNTSSRSKPDIGPRLTACDLMHKSICSPPNRTSGMMMIILHQQRCAVHK
ncbi:hypothetical protein IFM5058_10654 [Aspergillus udagawae]|nr:hypothetical protein IFM5058_10654 [Aspergillus udagawae]